MPFLDFLFALVVAILAGSMLAGALGWKRRIFGGSGRTILFLFIMFLLAIWAGGIWIAPFGPLLWGAYWAPFLAAALFVTLVLAAVISSHPHRPRNRREAIQQAETKQSIAVAFGLFFWLLLALLIASIIIRYVWFK
jgi:hypothetical protein